MNDIGDNMKKEFEEIKEIADSLKRSLIELDIYLDYFSECDSKLERDIFIDCKIQQLDALDYTNDILKLLESKLQDS